MAPYLLAVLRAFVLAAAFLLGWLQGRGIPSWGEDSLSETNASAPSAVVHTGIHAGTYQGCGMAVAWFSRLITRRVHARLGCALFSGTLLLSWQAWPPLVDDALLRFDPISFAAFMALQRWFWFPVGMFLVGLTISSAWHAQRRWFRG